MVSYRLIYNLWPVFFFYSNSFSASLSFVLFPRLHFFAHGVVKFFASSSFLYCQSVPYQISPCFLPIRPRSCLPTRMNECGYMGCLLGGSRCQEKTCSPHDARGGRQRRFSCLSIASSWNLPLAFGDARNVYYRFTFISCCLMVIFPSSFIFVFVKLTFPRDMFKLNGFLVLMKKTGESSWNAQLATVQPLFLEGLL